MTQKEITVCDWCGGVSSDTDKPISATFHTKRGSTVELGYSYVFCDWECLTEWAADKGWEELPRNAAGVVEMIEIDSEENDRIQRAELKQRLQMTNALTQVRDIVVSALNPSVAGKVE